MAANRTLSRLLRKRPVRALLERYLAADGYLLETPDGRVLFGDEQARRGESAPVELSGDTVGRIWGERREVVAAILSSLAELDAETRALAQESLLRYRELTMLYDISERIIGAPDVQSVAAAVCDEAMRCLDCDGACILLLNAESGLLETVSSSGRPLHSRTTLEVGEGLLGGVMASGAGEIVNDVAADPRGVELDAGSRSVVCAPLRVKDATLGLVVVGRAARRDFIASDLQLLAAMASHAATAMEVSRLGTELGKVSRKPADLIYGVDDAPPVATALVLSAQHVFVAMMSLAYPVLVVLEANGTRADAASVVSMSLLAMAVATALQVRRIGPLGAGYLLPHITSAIYLGPSLLAARIGGLGVVFAMTALAGIVCMVIAPLLRRFRRIFPPEVSGVVVLMVGLSMVPVGLVRLAGLGGEDTVSTAAEWGVGLFTLATIVALTVAPLGRLRLYSTAVGVAAGYAAAFATGLVDSTLFAPLGPLPWIGVHRLPDISYSVEVLLVVPFAAAALAATVKSAGLIVSVQKSNDVQWKRPDTRSVSGGVTASGASTVVSGALGGVGIDVSAGSIGLASATGCTARRLGYYIAGVLALLAFVPKLTAAIALMPSPVMGAGLLYVACHLITSGTELITARMLDSKRVYIIGLSLVAGVGALAVPDVLAGAPDWAAAVIGSPLALATIVAVVLNAALTLGVSSRADVTVALGDGMADAITRFVDRQGAAWGARSDVMRRAAPALIEWCEELAQDGGAHASGGLAVEVALTFDEFLLVARVRPDAAGSELPSQIGRRIAARYDCVFDAGRDGQVQLTFEH